MGYSLGSPNDQDCSSGSPNNLTCSSHTADLVQQSVLNLVFEHGYWGYMLSEVCQYRFVLPLSTREDRHWTYKPQDYITALDDFAYEFRYVTISLEWDSKSLDDFATEF